MTDTGTISQAQKDYAKFIAAQRKECANTFTSERKQFRAGREAIGALGEIVFADHYLLEHPGVTLLGSDEHKALLGDVDIYQVKTTDCTNEVVSLIVPGVEIDRYPNSPFVLVQLLLPDTYNLVGWLYGWQIAELAWQHVEHDDNSGGSYWVKSYKLWTMADLPTA